MPYHSQQRISDDTTPKPQDPKVRTDSYKRDKGNVVNWASGTIAAAVLGWGIWATNQINAVDSVTKVEHERLISIDSQSRQRDEALAQLAAQSAAAIQTQLAQIQAQLTEIQRGMRYGSRP